MRSIELSSASAGYTALCALALRATGKKTVTVPIKTVQQMLESYEDMLDIVAFDAVKQRKTEYFPKALVDQLIAGDNPLRVYREYRGLTQQALAKRSGVSRDMIAMIETNKKNGSISTVKKLASALKIDLEDIA
jgi:mRNA interferase RelE/StbE